MRHKDANPQTRTIKVDCKNGRVERCNVKKTKKQKLNFVYFFGVCTFVPLNFHNLLVFFFPEFAREEFAARLKACKIFGNNPSKSADLSC